MEKQISTGRVLFVDDEPNILDGIRRHLRKQMPIETAGGGEEGLEMVRRSGPFALVVSDMRMPGMNGAEFLAHVRKLHPDTVRMVLSGQSDLQATIDAVNEGQIFRFLRKPCSAESLWSAVSAGLEQYRLVNAERELLEKTLTGAVSTLTEILGIANPEARMRAMRVQGYVEALVAAVKLPDAWEFRLAGTLSQLGCITLPPETLSKVFSGATLSADEQRLYDSHYDVASRLLARIPRLAGVADMIARQMRIGDLAGPGGDLGSWDRCTQGAVILKLATEFDRLLARNASPAEACSELQREHLNLPRSLLNALKRMHAHANHMEVSLLRTAQLVPGMVLDQDVCSVSGSLIVSRGEEVTSAVIARLRAVASDAGLVEPIRVLAPA